MALWRKCYTNNIEKTNKQNKIWGDVLFLISNCLYEHLGVRTGLPPHVGKGWLHCPFAKHWTAALPCKTCPRFVQWKRRLCPGLACVILPTPSTCTLSGRFVTLQFSVFWKKPILSRSLHSMNSCMGSTGCQSATCTKRANEIEVTSDSYRKWTYLNTLERDRSTVQSLDTGFLEALLDHPDCCKRIVIYARY